MRIGLCTISNKEAAVEDVIDAAADAGYDGVEVWGKEPHVGDGSPETCEAIAAATRRRGIDLATYGSYLAVGTDAFEDEFERELGVADALGADRIRVWPGDREYGDHSRAEWDAAVEDLVRLADRAAAIDVAVTVEKHAGRLTNTGEGAKRLIEDVDHPNCGLNWQPSFDLSEEELLEEASTLAPLSNNVHVQAPAERGGRERSLLSEAYFDVGAVLDRFEAAGFDGDVEVEFVSDDHDYETAIGRDLEYLRRVAGPGG